MDMSPRRPGRKEDQGQLVDLALPQKVQATECHRPVRTVKARVEVSLPDCLGAIAELSCVEAHTSTQPHVLQRHSWTPDELAQIRFFDVQQVRSQAVV